MNGEDEREVQAAGRRPWRSRPGFGLALVLVVAGFVRLYHLGEPLIDQMNVKQVFGANKARNIARPPLSPLRNELDFLAPSGSSKALTEEVPIYHTLIALSYAAFGEAEWIGRLWTIATGLLAIVALFELVRREFDDRTAVVASALMAATPLHIFYSRVILPDPGMLAFMILSACAYRRFLDGEGRRWLIAAACAGAMAAFFKYYGLMVILPLADMARRRNAERAGVWPGFVLVASAMIAPVGVWLVAVFAAGPNPATTGTYFLWQSPGWIVHPRLYERLFLGFLLRDCGPILGGLMAVGVASALRRKSDLGPIPSWSAMGLIFFFLMAPKVRDHDYYELMMLPAAAMWGALGWSRLWGSTSGSRRSRSPRVGVAAVALAFVVQSPWLMGAKFETEQAHTIIADRLRGLLSPEGRSIVIGQVIGWPIVHYSGHQGWVDQSSSLPDDWRARFGGYRDLGAEFLVVYFDPSVSDPVRATYRPLLEEWPVVEHREGMWYRRKQSCEYTILDLRRPEIVARRASTLAGGRTQ